MLEIKYIRENLEFVKENLHYRNIKNIDLDNLLSLDAKRRALLKEIESLKQQQNDYSKEVAAAKAKGIDTSLLIDQVTKLSNRIKELAPELKLVEDEIENIQLIIPNICDQDVPKAHTENDNIDVRIVGQKRDFDFKVEAHEVLGTKLGILDFEASAKMSGARFCLYREKGARLLRSIAAMMLDLHTEKHGYTEMFTPFLVKEEAMYSACQLPKFKDEAFITTDNMYLIPTAEVALVNVHKDEILHEDKLPLKYVAYSSCFRREAGSYGKDTKGLIRHHQFEKVELVKLVKPENAKDELESLVNDAENVLKMLNLPYKVVLKCIGDTGFHSSKTYDLEVWFPHQNKYREISSCSTTGSFQARRLKTKYRKENGKESEYVHILNGSGLAIGRTLAAIIENYQNADGSITVPEALVKYMGGIKIIK